MSLEKGKRVLHFHVRFKKGEELGTIESAPFFFNEGNQRVVVLLIEELLNLWLNVQQERRTTRVIDSSLWVGVLFDEKVVDKHTLCFVVVEVVVGVDSFLHRMIWTLTI